MDEVHDKFITPFPLEDYDMRVNCSYWTFWKPDGVRLWREPQHRDGAAEGERERIFPSTGPHVSDKVVGGWRRREVAR